MIHTFELNIDRIFQDKDRILDEFIRVQDNKAIVKGSELMGLSEMIKEKDRAESILKNFGVNQIELTRVDIALDLQENFKEKENLLSLFIYCIAVMKGKENIVYSTIDSCIAKRKNLKLKLGRKEITIYDCSDIINRKGNTRIEYRSKNIENKQIDKKKVSKEIDIYNNLLNDVIKEIDKGLIQKVEIATVEKIYKEYQENLINTFQPSRQVMDLISWANSTGGILLTRNMIVLLLNKMGYKGNPNNFIKRFKEKRELNLVTKKELLDFIKLIKNDNKKILRN